MKNEKVGQGQEDLKEVGSMTRSKLTIMPVYSPQSEGTPVIKKLEKRLKLFKEEFRKTVSAIRSLPDI